jgi:hypothetical protein
MKTVLIIGAGVTRSTSMNKPLKKRPPLDTDFFQIANVIDPVQYKLVHSVLQDLVGEYSRVLEGSLELATTYLYMKAVDSKPNSKYHHGYLELLKLLTHVLASTTNDIKTGHHSLLYRFLLSEFKTTQNSSDFTIITFNYDIAIERILEEISSHANQMDFKYPGCYRLSNYKSVPETRGFPSFKAVEKEHDGVAILKLHGSLSWQSNHTSDMPTPNALYNPNRDFHVINSTKVAPSLSWKRKKRRVYLKPVIVPPVSGKKGMMHNAMFEVWSNAAKALKEADRIVIAGYSCPPLDLEARILLSENLRLNDNKRIYIVDPNAETASKFVELCGVNHVTIYSSLADWVKDAQH